MSLSMPPRYLRPETPAKRTGLCRACYAAVHRRMAKGEVWDEALADRIRQMERGRRGLVSGQGKRVATMLLLCLLPGWLLAAESKPAKLRALTVGYAAATLADAYTSMRGFDRGFTEANPAFPERPTDSRFIAQVVIVDSAFVLAAWKLRHTHPRLARWTLITGMLIHGAAARHNYRLIQRTEE